MTARKYLVLMAVVFLGSVGNAALSRGMKAVGNVTLSNWTSVFSAMANPWVLGGTVLLILFMACYLSALSWADLTYVLPATALGYVVTALLAQWFLHETITPQRWLGIVLITLGVGFVAGGPSVTPAPQTAVEEQL